MIPGPCGPDNKAQIGKSYVEAMFVEPIGVVAKWLTLCWAGGPVWNKYLYFGLQTSVRVLSVLCNMRVAIFQF